MPTETKQQRKVKVWIQPRLPIGSEELFEVPESLSPYAAFKRKHKIETHRSECVPEGEEPWNAWFGCADPGEFIEKYGGEGYGTAETEIDAVFKLAKMHNLEGWDQFSWPNS